MNQPQTLSPLLIIGGMPHDLSRQTGFGFNTYSGYSDWRCWKGIAGGPDSNSAVEMPTVTLALDMETYSPVVQHYRMLADLDRLVRHNKMVIEEIDRHVAATRPFFEAARERFAAARRALAKMANAA